MNINRHNYEEFFLLYVDNELNIAQRKAVEAFIAQNPDLRAELEILQESVLPADESIVFSNKESLLRTASAPNPVNETNCEEYFVLYADDELTNEEKDLVEQFVYRNPQHQAAFELMQQVKLMPDTSIVFPDKYALYRHEEDDRKPVPVIRMRFWKIAVAAAVLFFVGGTVWYLNSDKGSTTSGVPTGLADNKNNKGNQTQQPTVTTSPDQTTPDTIDQQGPTVVPAPANTADQQKEQQVQQQQRDFRTVAPKNDAMATVKEDKQEKNIINPRNIPVTPDVQHTEALADNRKTEKTNEADKLKPSTGIAETIDNGTLASIDVPVKGTEIETNKTNASSFGPDTDPELNPNTVSSTDNKKNKMRGFFRRVSRVFEKTASLNSDGDERKGIRIASFEIALK